MTSVARKQKTRKDANQEPEESPATWAEFIRLGREALEKTGLTREQVSEIVARVREEVYGGRR